MSSFGQSPYRPGGFTQPDQPQDLPRNVSPMNPAAGDYLIQPPQGAGASALLAWIVILACVGLVVYKNVTNAKREEQAADQTAQMQLKLSTRMAIGFRALGLDPTGANANQFITSIDDQAKTPDLKIRAAIAAGEIKGDEEAQKRLEAIASDWLVANCRSGWNVLEFTPPDEQIEQDVDALKTVYIKDAGASALDDAASDRLKRRYPYFSRVALSHGVPDTVEPRSALVADAKKLTIAFIVIIVVVGLIFLLALGLLITAIVLAAMGKLRRGYQPAISGAGSVFLEAFALYMVLYIGLAWTIHKFTSGGLGWALALLAIIPVTMLYVRMRGVSGGEVARGFGWNRGRGAFVEMACGVGGYLAGMPIIAAVLFGMTFQLIKYSGKTPSHPIQFELGGDASQVALLYLVACVMAPVLEETMFRGAFFHHLRRRHGWWISALVVAVIFAIIHPQGWTVAPTLAAIAMVLAAIREWRGSIIAPMVAHACNNGLVLTIGIMVMR